MLSLYCCIVELYVEWHMIWPTKGGESSLIVRGCKDDWCMLSVDSLLSGT